VEARTTIRYMHAQGRGSGRSVDAPDPDHCARLPETRRPGTGTARRSTGGRWTANRRLSAIPDGLGPADTTLPLSPSKAMVSASVSLRADLLEIDE
jgi:hypothetical protein